MTMVTSYDWESDTFTQHTDDLASHQVWREAVEDVADKARETLPDCAGRVDAAVKIVLQGDVELMPDGKARVRSQSNGRVAYHVVNGECPCRDYAKAPSNWCKHRIAYGLAKRARTLTERQLAERTATPDAPAPAPPDTPAAPLPEAPVSITLKAMLHGHEVLVTLRGVDFASVKAQVEDASQWLKAQSGHTADETPQCPKHGVPMQLNHKDGRSWWSHKTLDGWCKGK